MPAQEQKPVADGNPTPEVRIEASRLFTRWLRGQKASLVFTTYQAGKMFLIGLKPDDSLAVFERSFDRCMGLAVRDRTLWLASRFQLWRFVNILDPGNTHQGYDALYVPMAGHTTGDVDIHDLALLADGTPVFVVTLFNCFAALGQEHSFRPFWIPPFINRLAAEDRCHLNGLALDETGYPRYATLVSRTNVVEAWREHRADGGVLIDTVTGEILCEGLSMPHSPRWYRGRVWLLNAGTGELGHVDPKEKVFRPVAFCPGFLRGLAFLGDYAVVGLSKPRHNRTFQGLPLNDRLNKEGIAPRCGLQVIHTDSGDASHTLAIEGFIEELYDVAVLPGIFQPMALGFKTHEIEHVLRMDELQPLGIAGSLSGP
ncbi:MAG: TIGR03032 family protein [Magnetococcales bacterium]|nr:TIGR03032 family protein [Magnetococcales bacterium]